MSISVGCPGCRRRMKAPDHAAGRTVKCPECGTPFIVPTPTVEESERPRPRKAPAEQVTFRELPPPPPAEPEPDASPENDGFDFAALDDDSRRGTEAEQLDIHTRIAISVAIAGLTLLAVSPFFKWISFATGGMIGIRGDGKIVLGVSLAAIAVSIAVLIKPKLLSAGGLAVQAWGTVAVFWMAGLIWKVGSILESEVGNNPFVGLIATQIGPGSGLYMGLIGALIAAGALGFVAVRRVLVDGRMKAYFATQVLSMVLGAWLAFFVGPSGSSKPDAAEHKKPEFAWPFAGEMRGADHAAEQPKWKTRHNVSDKQWDEMIATYKARKDPEFVTESDWWEEAKEKTPAELNKRYPPLEPREWYKARWVGGSSDSRELDYNFSDSTPVLEVTVIIRTEPDLPIKELHGRLAFVKDRKVVYQTQLTEQPRVSFTDMHFVFLKIPYDDNNAGQRTLRFAKESELTPMFRVTKVILADGTEKAFD